MLGKTASRTSRPSRSDREFTGDSERRNLSLPFGSEQRADERRNLPLPFGSKERPDEAPAPAPPSPSRSRLGLVSIFPPPPPPFLRSPRGRNLSTTPKRPQFGCAGHSTRLGGQRAFWASWATAAAWIGYRVADFWVGSGSFSII